MVCLNNINVLPENAEWSYLYAIADVYKNYSSPHFDKNDPAAPHPLTDSEVIHLLGEKYNLKRVHRNTVISMRTRLESFFGFEFGIYKKGKYIKQQAGGLKNEDYLVMISLIVKNSPLISTQRSNEMIDFLSYFTTSKETKELIKTISKKPIAKREYDYFDKFIVLSKAIINGNNIIIDYPGFRNPEKMKPTEIRIDSNQELKLFCDLNERMWYWHSNSFDIKRIKSISVLKKGRPSK